MTQSSKQKIVGVLGGMGPLSSAEFLRTIYEHSGRECDSDQESPVVMLYSDPTFPDRTDQFLKGHDEVLLKRLTEALSGLIEIGAAKIVICCMTIHYLLPKISRPLADRVISMLDVIYEAISHTQEKHLLVCSSGTHKLNLMQSHPHWSRAKNQIVFPDDGDQERIHKLIYEIKRDRSVEEMVSFLKALLSKYGVDSFIAGCSEIHIVSKRFPASNGSGKTYRHIDPLSIIATQITKHEI